MIGMAWLAAIDLSAWLALAAIVVGAFVAYHVAITQGIFWKPRLLAKFSAPNRPEPAVMVLNLHNNEQRSQIVLIYFYVENLGQIPITNIVMQFNLYPRRDIANLWRHLGPIYRSPFPGSGDSVYSVEDRGIIEYRIPGLALDGAYVIALPYLITREHDRSGERSGIINVHLTYDQGPKIRKGLYICVAENIDIKDAAAITPILENFAKGEGPIRLKMFDMMYDVAFNIPLIKIPWHVMEVRTTPISKSLAVQTEAIEKKGPTIYEGTFQTHLGGRRRAILLLMLWTLVLLSLLALGKTITVLVLGSPLW